ncbi:hypothetical protein C5B97_02360 [Pseudoclavibacter sp. RFBB5]|nr:hypothetical protein C5B97_02360 [Pseudoclavibacter sp. RFBB5]
MDLVLALSPKDKGMLQTISTGTSVVSVTPPLTLERIETPSVHERSAGVLFVGAFHRPENIDAALWLLREIWPLVRARNPAAELVIAGASPTAQMRILANDLGRVTVTGYVPSLYPYYASCLVNVVPLRQGAGVKFKTIDALLMSQAVVSTSVGLEGIHAPEGTVWARAENADEIAGAILEALKDPRHSASVGKKAAEWAAAEYSHENYSSTLLREYARLITARVRE